MLIRRKIKKYNDMSKEELLALKESLNKEYAEAKAKGLALDMSRGKPSAKQLDVSLGLLDTINSSSDLKALGIHRPASSLPSSRSPPSRCTVPE